MVANLTPPDARDKRNESFKIDMNSLEVLDKIGDEEVRKIISPLVVPSIDHIVKSGASLGFIKPNIQDYDIDIISTELIDKQLQLEADGSVAPMGKVKLDQESSYVFTCQDRSNCSCSRRPHKISIHDWEVNELYRNVIKGTKEPATIKEKMRQKWFDWMTQQRDVFFMMGTHNRWKTWLIVSVLYLKKQTPVLVKPASTLAEYL